MLQRHWDRHKHTEYKTELNKLKAYLNIKQKQ